MNEKLPLVLMVSTNQRFWVLVLNNFTRTERQLWTARLMDNDPKETEK